LKEFTFQKHWIARNVALWINRIDVFVQDECIQAKREFILEFGQVHLINRRAATEKEAAMSTPNVHKFLEPAPFGGSEEPTRCFSSQGAQPSASRQPVPPSPIGNQNGYNRPNDLTKKVVSLQRDALLQFTIYFKP
jgi:hypothetical protein